MKLKSLLIAVIGLLFSAKAIASNAYEIKVKVDPLRDSVIYLGNHYGDKQYVRDTTYIGKDGWATFKGSEPLPGGIYLIVLYNKTYFEVVVTADEQKFSVETDTIDYVANMKINGSSENKMFNDHQKFLGAKSKEGAALRARLDANKSNDDSTKIIKEKLSNLDKDVKAYRLKIVEDHPKSFMANIIRAMQEPDVPEAPKDEKGNITDSTFQFRYYKAHYLDKLDFSDDRLLRTPIFNNKVKTYLDNLTMQHPDSLCQSVDTIITKARANKDVFKYCVATLANTYETSKIMGFDKVFVHIAERYYLTKDAYWADDTLKKKLQERVDKIKPNILFTPAHDLVMPDTSISKMFRLYDVPTKYTVLAFWDPTCSHCKTEIPKLSAYRDSVRAKGLSFEVFSVGIESDIELWKKFIREKNLRWINVSDLYNNTQFRNYYDIYSTPVIYLLDSKKRIIAKRLDTEKLHDFINDLESGKIKLPQ